MSLFPFPLKEIIHYGWLLLEKQCRDVGKSPRDVRVLEFVLEFSPSVNLMPSGENRAIYIFPFL